MPLLFFKGLNLSSMRCSEAESAAETGLKCICVYIYPALDSSRSEDSQLGLKIVSSVQRAGKLETGLSIFHPCLM